MCLRLCNAWNYSPGYIFSLTEQLQNISVSCLHGVKDSWSARHWLCYEANINGCTVNICTHSHSILHFSCTYYFIYSNINWSVLCLQRTDRQIPLIPSIMPKWFLSCIPANKPWSDLCICFPAAHCWGLVDVWGEICWCVRCLHTHNFCLTFHSFFSPCFPHSTILKRLQCGGPDR